MPVQNIVLLQISKLNMQANCCVFPAPSQFELTKIIQHIVLIPKQSTQPAQYYVDKYITKTNNLNNEFMCHVQNRKKVENNNLRISTAENDSSNMKKFDVYTSLKQKAEKLSAQHMKNTPIALQQKLNHQTVQKVENEIPCVFIPSHRKDKIMVFFHGNGEDITTSYEFGYFISSQLEVSVLIVQYQGYSIYKGSANPQSIVTDSKTVIQYLISSGYDPKDILLFGRSIGGAVAFQAASHFEPCCLILLSPFLSLKKVAEDLYGKLASTFLKQTFDNAIIAQTVKCPILIIHGLKDTLVPYQHSISILQQCKGFTRLKLAQNMTHVKFNFKVDFVQPVRKFLNDLKIRISNI